MLFVPVARIRAHLVHIMMCQCVNGVGQLLQDKCGDFDEEDDDVNGVEEGSDKRGESDDSNKRVRASSSPSRRQLPKSASESSDMVNTDDNDVPDGTEHSAEDERSEYSDR
jgi:hypothetical protein